MIATVAILQGLALVTVAGAAVVAPGAVGGFEDDGNLVAEPAVPGEVDWDTAGTVRTVVDETNPDGGFQGSSKEEAPGDWVCNFGGQNPAKNNILRAYANVRPADRSVFVDLAWIRESGLGDAHVNFEFNRSPSPPAQPGVNVPCPLVRQVGDLLISYDFPGGGDPATIRTWRWSGATWVETDLPATAVAAATNPVAVVDPLAGGALLPARTFGEVTIDLSQVFPAEVAACSGFAFLTVRSRTSQSINAALQDRLPTAAFDLAPCGTIAVEKVDADDATLRLAGGVFGLFETGRAAPVATCTTDASGGCSFPLQVVGGLDYVVTELTPPPGYSRDPNASRPVTARAGDVVTVRFVNSRIVRVGPSGVPLIDIDKLVNGVDRVRVPVGDTVTYTLRITNTGEVALVVTALTDLANRQGVVLPAACTVLTGRTLAPGESFTCEYRSTVTTAVDNVATVRGRDSSGRGVTDSDPASVETFASGGPLGGPAGGPGPSIALEKLVNGQPSVVVHAGDPLVYTIRVTNTGPVDLAIAALADVADGQNVALPGTCEVRVQSTLAPGESFTCEYRTTAASDTTNVATVEGVSPTGVRVRADDTASADVIRPAIEIVKTVDRASPRVGDTVTFTYDVKNVGDTPLTAIVVSDDVLGEIGRIDRLEPAESRQLTKTMVVTADSAPRNVGTARGTDSLGRPVSDTDDATIAIVLGTTFERPAPQQSDQEQQPAPAREPLAKTGFDLSGLGGAGGLLLIAGLGLLRHGRRLEDDDEAVSLKDRLAGHC